MNIDTHGKVKKEDKPLTRTDVERFLLEAGSSDKLNLSGRNLKGINLTFFSLQGADLSGTNLSGADLVGVNLSRAFLNRAILNRAILSRAILNRAILNRAILSTAFLNGADLSGAIFNGADLSGAILNGANLSGADLSGANLSGADLSGADLSGANLSGVDLTSVDLSGVTISEATISETTLFRAIDLDKPKVVTAENTSTFRIRIIEEPLTAQNVITIVSAITELHTKTWLIQQGQFSNLINYAQTHDSRFTKEANLRIGTMTHNSPALIDFLVSSASIAGTTTLAFGLKIAIDGIVQSPLRFKDKQLDIA